MADETYTIRWAVVDDARAIAEVHVASWLGAYRGIVPDEILDDLSIEQREQRFREAIINEPPSRIVVEAGGQIVGFCTFGDCRDEDKSKDTTGEICTIYLLPSHWRKGLGRKLITWAEKELQTRGKREVILWALSENTESRRFYEAMGYRYDGTEKISRIGENLPNVRYSKPL